MRPVTQARVFALTQQEAHATPDAIIGMLHVFGYLARVLINSGATHLFITPSFVPYASVRPTPIGGEFGITLPTGESRMGPVNLVLEQSKKSLVTQPKWFLKEINSKSILQ